MMKRNSKMEKPILKVSALTARLVLPLSFMTKYKPEKRLARIKMKATMMMICKLNSFV